jgi:hypothetical protein
MKLLEFITLMFTLFLFLCDYVGCVSESGNIGSITGEV